MKRAAEEWSATFDSTKELISIHGIDHKLVRVNRAFANTFKARAEELVGRNCFEVIHGMTEPRPDCPHSQALKTRKPVKQEYFEPHLGLYLEVSVSPIVNKKGEVFGTVHVVADITERKKMEEDRKKHLHELEVFYKANIGREERILELKNGIKELEGKLGKES
jgi:PAS domain S-box-containing protein